MIYSLHTKKEVFNADKILRWAEIPYQVIDLDDIDYHPNDTIVVSPKHFDAVVVDNQNRTWAATNGGLFLVETSVNFKTAIFKKTPFRKIYK